MAEQSDDGGRPASSGAEDVQRRTRCREWAAAPGAAGRIARTTGAGLAQPADGRVFVNTEGLRRLHVVGAEAQTDITYQTTMPCRHQWKRSITRASRYLNERQPAAPVHDEERSFTGGGEGGRIEEYDWDGS